MTTTTDTCTATSRFYGRCTLNPKHPGTQHTSELGRWCECCSPKGRTL